MKLIQTQDYLLLIDEEAKIGKYVWDKEQNYMRENVSRNNITDFDIEIIAYYPLNSEAKELDLPLLPNPFEDNGKIGKDIVNYCSQYKGTDKYTVAMLAIEFGYNLNKDRQFTLEDIKKVIDRAYCIGYFDKKINEHCHLGIKREEEIIQSLSTQQLPKEFIPEYYIYNKGYDKPEDYPYQECKVLKTIINSEGKQESVGSYKY